MRDPQKLYSVGIPAAQFLILQVGNCSGFPRLWLSSRVYKMYSLSPFWYEATFVLMGWTWSPAASLSRPPATLLGCCNSRVCHVILPAKILSSAAAASISSSSLQLVTPVTLFWMNEGPTGEYINEMINPPFHVSVFKHSFTTMYFESDNLLPLAHKTHTNILHLSQPSFTDTQMCSSTDAGLKKINIFLLVRDNW